MGLDAYVPETDVHYSLGSYGWYHSFRTAVCEKLENGKWGSRYPLLMNHSDCDGEYSPEESALLKEEVKEIRERFKNLTYPVGIYRNREGKTLGIAPKYGEDGFFVFCANGFDFGVHELGIVVGARFFPLLRESKRQRLVEFVSLYRGIFQEAVPTVPAEGRLFVAYFDRMELIEKDGEKFWRGTKAESSVDFPADFDPCCPLGTVLIEKDTIPALEFFDVPLGRLEKLAETSMKTKRPIIFC